MGKHLRLERWFDKQSTGTLRLKRVSAQAEKQFPREWRFILSRDGAGACVSALMKAQSLTLAQAWDKLKRMVND